MVGVGIFVLRAK